MGFNKNRAKLPGLIVVVGLLLSGCFATEPPQNQIAKMEKAVLPSVQRLVHNNPFAKDRNPNEPVGDIATHLVDLRLRPMPAYYRLLQPGHGAVCADSNDISLASFSSLISVDRRRSVAQQIGDPCHEGENTVIANFDVEGVNLHRLSELVRKPFSIVDGKIYWVIDRKVTMQEILRYDDSLVAVCQSADEKAAFIAMQSPTLKNQPSGDGAENIWGMVAVRKGDEGQTYRTSRWVPMKLSARDPAAFTIGMEKGAVSGQILRPRADGFSRARFRFSHVAGLIESERQEVYPMECTVDVGTDLFLQAAAE